MFKLTSVGSDVSSYVQLESPRVKIQKRQNERSRLTFTLKPGCTIAKFNEVYAYDTDGVTALFGGVCIQFRTRGIERGAATYFTEATCSDFLTYTDFCNWTKTYTADVTLKQVLTDLRTDVLAAYGITIDAAQDNGDTFEASSDVPLVFTNAKVSQLLRSLGDRCDPPRVTVMSPLKALSIVVPGVTSAPFVITDAAPHCMAFEIESSTFMPVTKITLQCGTASGVVVLHEVFTADGITASWTLETLGALFILGLSVNGVAQTVSAPGDPGDYTFDLTTQILTPNDAPDPIAGDVLIIEYEANSPFTVSRDTGASPTIADTLIDETLTDVGPAILAVEGLLAKRSQDPDGAVFETFEKGWSPAQALTATQTCRGVVAPTAYTISSVDQELTEFERSGVRLWKSTVRATKSTIYQGGYLDKARAMFGGTSGASNVVSSGGGGSVALTSPYPLGGTDQTMIPQGTPGPTAFLNYFSFVCKADFSGVVRVWLWALPIGGIAVTQAKATLYNITDSVAVNNSGWVTAITRDSGEITFAVNLLSGKKYVLFGESDTTGVGLFGIGQLETT